MSGIIGYGAYIPRNRIRVEEIAKVWGADAPSYKKGLELQQKSVPALDEDTITLSVEAARNALRPNALVTRTDAVGVADLCLEGEGCGGQVHEPEDS